MEREKADRVAGAFRLTRPALALAALALAGGGYIAGFVTSPGVRQWLYERARRQRTERFLKQPAPDFEVTTLAGERWRLSNHRGQVVVLDFMASWCSPCVGAYPALKSVHEKYAGSGEVVVFSVSLDEDEAALRSHLALYEVPWAVAHEPGKGFDNSVARQYRITGIPAIWIIDRTGRVAALDAWGEEILSSVDTLLKQAGREQA